MGIGLVEVIWKMINTIINSRLRTAILFHVSLHGFSQGRGVGMETVEVTVDQTSTWADMEEVVTAAALEWEEDTIEGQINIL